MDSCKLHVENGLVVIALQTELGTQREETRQRVRVAIQEALALLLNCSVSEIKLQSQTGQAVKLADANHHIGLSISHEPGLSVAAINMHGQVGVDLMAIDSIPTYAELPMIAAEYLGAKVAEYISSQTAETQKKAFATAWTTFEASLKLNGLSLVEWSPASDEQLKNVTSIKLNLADGYIGAIAYEAECHLACQTPKPALRKSIPISTSILAASS